MQLKSKLKSLYLQYDSMIDAGEDVVADIRKEMANLELTYLKDFVFSKIAKILNAETKDLRCVIDCSMQVSDGSVSYSFCTGNSPIVRAVETDCYSASTPLLRYGVHDLSALNKLLSQIEKYVNEIQGFTSESLSLLNEYQIIDREEKEKSKVRDENSLDKRSGILLYIENKFCNATGKLLKDGKIIILKGSILRADTTEQYKRKGLRDNLIKQFCTVTSQGIVVNRDLPPMTVSGASNLCLGRSSNGNVEWKDKDGIKLMDLNIEKQTSGQLWNL